MLYTDNFWNIYVRYVSVAVCLKLYAGLLFKSNPLLYKYTVKIFNVVLGN